MSAASTAALVTQLLGRSCFPPAGTPVDCAVSGGADSLALMYLAHQAGCVVTAHHVDHQLRTDSAADLGVVAAAAQACQIDVRSYQVDVEPGANLEARARTARFAVLPDSVMTGHTLDDRVETMLLNLLRGAARPGLRVLQPSVRHPIARLRRADTHALCAGLGWAPVVDPTNESAAHLRNRVRHELVPLLDELAQRDLAVVLERQGDLMAVEDDLLDDLAAELDPTDARQIAAAPVALARRALRRWIVSETRASHPPGAAAIERALEVAQGGPSTHDLEGGHRIYRTYQRLRIEPPSVR